MVDLFVTKMNHKLPICVLPVPDANALNIDVLNILLEGMDGYAFCPVELIPKSHSINGHLQVQTDCSGSMVAHEPLVLRSGESVKPNLHYSFLTGLRNSHFINGQSNGQLLIRSAQTGPPNIRKRRPVFPPAGPVQYCALTRWRVVLPSCLDSMTS